MQQIYGAAFPHLQNKESRAGGTAGELILSVLSLFCLSATKEFLLPISPLDSMALKLLVSKRKSLPPRKVAWNWKLIGSSGHFGHIMPLKEQSEKKVTLLAKKIVPLAMRNPGYLNTFGPMKLYLEDRAHHEFLHLKVNDNILTKIRPLGTQVHQD